CRRFSPFVQTIFSSQRHSAVQGLLVCGVCVRCARVPTLSESAEALLCAQNGLCVCVSDVECTPVSPPAGMLWLPPSHSLRP
ncbi:unnamed protein product, partial [Larinioides sclopetarius]